MQRFFDYSLIFFNCLLLVFVLFENSIELPLWLTPSGKLHPLVLHLPIGLWAGVVIIFLLKNHLKDFAFLNQIFWNIAALGAAVTALVGMILALGGDYDSEQISNHKYSGVALSILMWLAAIFFEKINKNAVSYLIITVLFIMVGHWGGELTHGENYFSFASKSQPVNSNTVYESLVKPILQEKCASCHNASKTKGGLNLESVALMLKGGENGPALKNGNALESHMIKLIYLPREDKMHMPPKSKTQLTEEEKEILKEWINSGASESLTFEELQTDSPLKKYFKQHNEPTYTFKAADPEILKAVNTPFTVVQPVAIGNPALQASFFVSGRFDAKTLEALLKVKEQLVGLNLSKMPVKDDQLKVLSEFKNLETLNLSSTDVKGDFLDYIKDLKKLKSLSLANTNLVKKDINTLAKFTNLYVWEAGFSEKELTEIKAENPNIKIDLGSLGTEVVAINPPESNNNQAFVESGTKISLRHALPNTQIKYTLDGSEPDSLTWIDYKEPILVNDRVKIKAKAIKKGWLSSPTVEFDYLVLGIKPDSVLLSTSPSPQYSAKGAKSLIDKRKGDLDNFLDKSWLGYREKPFEAIFRFDKGTEISGVSVSMMEKLDSYIFPPKYIEVWGRSSTKGEILLVKHTPEQPQNFRPRKNIFYDLKIPANSYTEIKIKIPQVNPLPKWHPGKGTPGWVFIDEVVFN
jgi:hypothetical protein